jgi:cyclophilin family peptidyl-prolyl cis-trans isomerase
MTSIKVLTLCFVVLGMVTAGAARAANPLVLIETNHGNIKVELFEDKSPVTVKNFLSYVDDKFYDNTICHRVIEDFMIQGGGTGADRKEKKTKPPIKNEAGNGISNQRGTLAMARTNNPDSATAQFFINLKDNTFLDRKGDTPREAGYAVFGKVVEGMDVVDKIAKVDKTLNEMGEKAIPKEDVIIKSVKRVDAK